MNVLLSYHYFKNPQTYIDLAEAGLNVLVDSGAFSAHTQGKQINLEEYARFCVEVQDHVEGIFTLDVIGDPVASMENHLQLRARGLAPIPVWQGHTPGFPGLEEFMEGEQWVAIGSLVRTGQTTRTTNYNEKRISGFMRRVRGRARVHLLGYANRQWVPKFDPWSCDSANTTMTMVTAGTAKVYNHKTRRWFDVQLDGKTALDGRAFMFLRELFGSPPDFTPEVAFNRSSKVTERRFCWPRAIAHAGMANYYRHQWRTKHFFVDACDDGLRVFRFLHERGL